MISDTPGRGGGKGGSKKGKLWRTSFMDGPVEHVTIRHGSVTSISNLGYASCVEP